MSETTGAAGRLRWTTTAQEAPSLPGFEERVTHPEFQGIEFLHVRAKRILNAVPSGMPAPYTINAYRGCTHACSYCLVGDTPILMADGRTRPLADLRPGDRVYGTRREGRSRRAVTTEVIDQWATRRSAYRVRLAGGTTLVASGDHRFLTRRGWKHVTAGAPGRARRPHLMTTDRLLGPGSLGPRAGAGRSSVLGLRSDADLRVVAIEATGLELPMFDITTGTGDFIAHGVVSHNCFARPTHEYLDLGAGDDFDRVIVVKVNAVERLRSELAAPRWTGDHVAMGTNTDPYQRAEGRYRLTRGLVETLSLARNPFSILTKSPLVLRDLDLLTEAVDRVPELGVNLSVGTLDEGAWHLTEPGTPHPRRRLEAVAALNESGIASGVLVAPIIPGLTDATDQLDAVVRGALEAGARFITPIVLHLRPGVRAVFEARMRDTRPDLLERYQRLYGERGYAPTELQRRIAARVRRLVDRHGGIPRRRPRRGRAPQRPTRAAGAPDPTEQLALDL